MSDTEDLIRDLIESGAPANLVARVARLAAEVDLLKSKGDRKRTADRKRVAGKRISTEPQLNLEKSRDNDEVARHDESRATMAESRESRDNGDVACPSPSPLPSSSPPHPPNNYLPPAPIRSVPDGTVNPVALQRPIYTDSKHELWGEGVQILQQLGVPDRSARSNIGRWLRDQRDDAQRVLGAIQRARDARVIDPIPWITRALATDGSINGNAPRKRTVIDAANDRIADLDARIAAAEARETAERTSEDVARLLPPERRN